MDVGILLSLKSSELCMMIPPLLSPLLLFLVESLWGFSCELKDDLDDSPNCIQAAALAIGMML